MDAPLVSQDQSHMVWLALPALLTQSAACMESRFFAMMKWMPYGFPGSVPHGLACFACLADLIRSRHGIMILCHEEMDALWFPRICCMARFACLADSICSWHGIKILCHNEMDALWFPRISLTWLAFLPALLTVIGHGIAGKDIPIMARLAKARRWSKQ